MNFDKDAFAHGPIRSKIWLCQELSTHKLAVDKIYILGAWTGTAALFIDAMANVDYKKMVLVDINAGYLDQARIICNAIDCDGRLEIVTADANTFDYPKSEKLLVINTSTDNIQSDKWYQKIPSGSIVGLQGRNGIARDLIQPYETLIDFHKAYSMSTVYFVGEKKFQYPDHSYTRFMKIGKK